jgi:hypothetical protein
MHYTVKCVNNFSFYNSNKDISVSQVFSPLKIVADCSREHIVK